MSVIALDFLGYRYDPAVPAFVDAGPKYVFHRATRKIMDAAQLAAKMAAAKYTPTSKEKGPDAAWLYKHTQMLDTSGTVSPSTHVAPSTARFQTDAAGTISMNFLGKKLSAAAELVIEVKVDPLSNPTGLPDLMVPVALTADLTANAARTLIRDALNAKASAYLNASSAVNSVTIKPTGKLRVETRIVDVH